MRSDRRLFARAFSLTFYVTQRDVTSRPSGAGVADDLEVMAGEVSVDAAGERRGPGGNI
jgi:hypothetical protein